MKTLLRFARRLVVTMLVVTGILALGSGLGNLGCTVGLSLVQRAARALMENAQSLATHTH